MGFLLVLAALSALPATGADDKCAAIEFEPEPLPSDRLMPVTAEFRASVRYASDWVNTSETCVAPQCADVAQRIRFSMEEKPDYATSSFSPEAPSAAFNLSALRREANTQLTIRVGPDAPAMQDGLYRIHATGCGFPSAAHEFTIKNDHRSETHVSPGPETSESPEPSWTPEPVEFPGQSSVPGPGAAGFVLALCAAVFWIRRRA